MRLGTSLQRQRAGGIDHARVVGHEGQAHGLAAGGDDGLLERDHLLGAGLVLAGAGGFFHLEVVGTDKGAVAAHGGHLAHLGHGGQAAGELADDLFLVAAQLVDVDLGRAKVHPRSPRWLTSSITAATCSSALLGMQPTFRHTPPSVA
jgi:hypothetical protein